MFARWGALVYRFRRFVVVFSILLAIASLSLASQTSGALSSGGWLDNNSESAEVQRARERERLLRLPRFDAERRGERFQLAHRVRDLLHRGEPVAKCE